MREDREVGAYAELEEVREEAHHDGDGRDVVRVELVLDHYIQSNQRVSDGYPGSSTISSLEVERTFEVNLLRLVEFEDMLNPRRDQHSVQIRVRPERLIDERPQLVRRPVDVDLDGPEALAGLAELIEALFTAAADEDGRVGRESVQGRGEGAADAGRCSEDEDAFSCCDSDHGRCAVITCWMEVGGQILGLVRDHGVEVGSLYFADNDEGLGQR